MGNLRRLDGALVSLPAEEHHASTARAAARAGLVGSAVLLAAALTITSAQAASGDLSYGCDYGVDTDEASGSATACRLGDR